MGVLVNVYLEETFSGDAVIGEKSYSEVRRFQLHDTTGYCVVEFWKKFCTAFADHLPRTDFELSWKDEEEEYVRISSNMELNFAINWCESKILKVYVKILATWGEDKVKDGKIVKPADKPSLEVGKAEQAEKPTKKLCIDCTTCGTGLIEVRYHCLICSDVDVCETCVPKHPQHPMLKLVDYHCCRSNWCEVNGNCLHLN